MRKFIYAAFAATLLLFTGSCKEKTKNEEKASYFAFTQAEMDIILEKYSSDVKMIGEPQVMETSFVIDSAKKIIIHEVLTTHNFQFTVPLDEKGQLITDPKEVSARKRNDCPGTGTVTCRLRCNGTGCTWSGCNSYPCSGGTCGGGCTLLDCKQLATGTGKKGTVMQ